MARHSRLASRVDANHPEIVRVLTQLGCSVATTASVGDGFPDLVVGIWGQTHLAEVKAGKGKLRDSQEGFQARWRGSTVWTLRSAEDALEMVNTIGREVGCRTTTTTTGTSRSSSRATSESSARSSTSTL